jgi:hypothetical protein
MHQQPKVVSHQVEGRAVAKKDMMVVSFSSNYEKVTFFVLIKVVVKIRLEDYETMLLLLFGHCLGVIVSCLWFTASLVSRNCCGVSEGSYMVVAGRAGPLYCVVTVLLPVPGDMSFTASLGHLHRSREPGH